ncbi:hypothetical protein [Paraglaciecola sp. MB-3u-78]|uniref:hypothetical protein n=1 Tax=Paraglaciecola sp. MB-3u-78 TaxID=2058332 RepID=UPI000C33289D|nr:hypothetical protein [Paraglaciecola sp. MB-3u-78]PKG96954.1 hypothetical protein CXF95_21825 [Paraglaciecola sp. MB-3u-78]
MNNKSTLRVVKVKPESEADIESLTSGSHDIAWTEELDAEVLLTGNQQSVSNVIFRTSPITGLPQNYTQYLANQSKNNPFTSSSLSYGAAVNKASDKEIRNAYLSLASNSASLIKQYFPEEMNQPIQSLEFIVSTYGAIDAWTDKNRINNVQASLSTGKAIVQAIDVFAPFFPDIRQIQPAAAIAGVAIKTAESAYLVYRLHNK